jgi:mannose-1-phosphate guanylyltransferase
LGDKTLFQASVLRLSESETMDFAAPIILMTSDFRSIATEQLSQCGIEAAAILL